MMKKTTMNTLSTTLVALLVSAGLLAGCSDADDHGHPHNGDEAHEHAEGDHSHDGEAPHEHEGGDHSHDGPETEAYYGDEADASSSEEMPMEAASDHHEHSDHQEHHEHHDQNTSDGHHDHGDGADDHQH